METIWGKKSRDVDRNQLMDRLGNYDHIMLDLGTGDGRYVHTLAVERPAGFIIGMDSCRENLREHSRAKLRNMLFVIASAQDLPKELNGLISHVTINFPWGSLLESLLTDEASLRRGLAAISRSTTSMEVRLNSGALAEAGTTLEAGAEKVYHNLIRSGWQLETPSFMTSNALRGFPTTWAKRLAFGRDPRAVAIRGWRLVEQADKIEQVSITGL